MRRVSRGLAYRVYYIMEEMYSRHRKGMKWACMIFFYNFIDFLQDYWMLDDIWVQRACGTLCSMSTRRRYFNGNTYTYSESACIQNCKGIIHIHHNLYIKPSPRGPRTFPRMPRTFATGARARRGGRSGRGKMRCESRPRALGGRWWKGEQKKRNVL